MAKKLVPLCKKALDRNIVVINIDNPLHTPTMNMVGISIPFIGSDNFAGSQLIGNYVKARRNGSGRVLVIEGIWGVENSDSRKKGFIRALTAGSSIEIGASESANWHTDESFSLTARLLSKNPDVDAIICANDSMALGAIQAINRIGPKKKIIVTGYDNIGSVRTEIRHGRIQATIELKPLFNLTNFLTTYRSAREMSKFQALKLVIDSSESKGRYRQWIRRNRGGEKAEMLGAGKFVKKPFTMEKIGLAVKQALEK